MNQNNYEILSVENIDNLYIKKTCRYISEDFGIDNIIEQAYSLNDEYIGDVVSAEMLCRKYKIKPQLRDPNHYVCSIGFSDETQEWYGWSHRAIYSFGIGSTINESMCGYVPSTVDELYVKHCEWYSDFSMDYTPKAYCDYENNRLVIEHIMSKKKILTLAPDFNSDEWNIDNFDEYDGEIDNDGLEGIHWKWETYIENQYQYPGRGVWTAKTLEDARKMAEDFAEDVS